MTKTLEELAYTKVSELPLKQARIFEPGDVVSRVLGELEESGRYEAVVTSGDRYGLVTIRDLLNIDQPVQAKLGDYSDGIWRVLSPAAPEDLVIDVARMLTELNVRAIPIVNGGEVAGVVSQVEISNALCEVPELADIPARELMERPVATLDMGSKVAEARRLMLDRGISHVPITESGRLVGVATAGNIVHIFLIPASSATRGDLGGEKVTRFSGAISAVMDARPLAVGPDASALDVARGLKGKEKSACVMLDDRGSVLGIITPRELISILLTLRAEEELPVYIMGLAEKEDFYEGAVAEDKVRRVVMRSLKFHPHITEVSVRIKRQQPTGRRARYQVTARAVSAVEHFNATAEGWDLMATFDDLCEKLDRTLRKAKPQPEASPRRRRPGRR
ncbi:hypothetical protein AC482_03580 [miscellaneous Crenarchaeota group-15 archaeon DG-45]|uniref:CBS domain-containing protein n=1 Tax=miscellaneous Crenarchaeota group-15 archaeon DG-45 TaxID=1685127 RepID=A0A0M0BQB1_9ARCH|nr:MAG: hypothetical protein AC482_03580 [miscellaneous Crenarchaeota group-15 archaeon DG-45]